MKNKISTLLLLSTISTFSFSAELIALKSGGEDTKALSDLKPASQLFSAAEQENFEIGIGIIQDRIYQKEEILKKLRDETRSWQEKLVICEQDFNAEPEKMAVLHAGYENQLDLILSTYTKTYELAQGIQSASNDSERNTYKNNLYYYLSYKIIQFQHYIAALPHKVPEHSLEDTFFDIIREKLCVGATKEYDIVTQYLKLSMRSGITNISLNNQKLYDTYNIPLLALQKEKIDGHPAFHGHIQTASPEAKALMSQINNRLLTLISRMHNVFDNLTSKVSKLGKLISSEENQDDEERLKEDILKIYQNWGPFILEAIPGYEACNRDARDMIQTVEGDLKKWLDKFDGSQGFRQLTTGTKQYVRNYIAQKAEEALQEQRRVKAENQAIIDAEAAEAEQKRLQKQREKKTRRKEKQKALKAEEALLSHAVSVNAVVEEMPLNTMSLHDMDTTDSADSSAKVALQGAITAPATRATTSPVIAPTFQAKWEILSKPTAQKEKVKTRGHAIKETEASISYKSETKQESILPEYFYDTRFQMLIENLLNERNERKLKSDFTCLKKGYNIPSENQEKKNKGYFMLVSPITQKRTVKTYHNLHDPENPYASLFMAMRQVLDDSQVSMAISLERL